MRHRLIAVAALTLTIAGYAAAADAPPAPRVGRSIAARLTPPVYVGPSVAERLAPVPVPGEPEPDWLLTPCEAHAKFVYTLCAQQYAGMYCWEMCESSGACDRFDVENPTCESCFEPCYEQRETACWWQYVISWQACQRCQCQSCPWPSDCDDWPWVAGEVGE